MNKKRLIGVLICSILLFTQINAYCANDFHKKELKIGDDEDIENATNIQTFTTEELPDYNKPVSGSVNSTVYTPTTYVPYYNQYPTAYYAYPESTYIFRTGVPYYTYGTPSYRISQPAYMDEFGYGGAASSMTYNYKGHTFNYNVGAGRGMYASWPSPYNPPPPPCCNHDHHNHHHNNNHHYPPQPPCCNHNNHNNNHYPPQPPGQIRPVNLPSNVIYKR
jgi:hypothetical protein